ncbi:hypothetical protein [Streptomyces sp. NPDC007369]|uniref:VMAP-C domain-containing protein n=1 Tax=Streptomyces sp. NPDC007369 TaxID=3154589 RepID=UPI0033E3864D
MTDSGQPGPIRSHPTPTTLTALRSELQEQLEPTSANPVPDVKALVRLLVRNRAPLKDVDRSAPPDRLVRQLVAWCATSASKADALADALEYVAGTAGTRQPDAAGTLRMLSDLLAARTVMNDEDLLQLQHLVEPRTVPLPDLHRLVQACLPPLSADLPQHCTSPWPTALHLLRRNVLPGGLPPLLAFIEYLAAVQSSSAAVSALRAWTQEKALQWGVLESLHACREEAAGLAGSTPSGTPRLVLVFLPDGLRSDLYTLRTWHGDADTGSSSFMRGEDAQVDFRDIAGAVYTWLEKWARRLSTADTISVEFWLPLRLVNEPVWEWCARSTPPREAPNWDVVVRSLDRLESPTLHTPWRTRWRRLMEDAAPGLPPAARSGRSGVPDEANLVVLNNPPDDEAGRRELMAAIREGAPAILWHREDCASPAFRTSVQRLIEQGPLKELPSRVSALRHGIGVRASAEEEGTVRGISLLWDDPDRPLPAMPALVAPSEAP